MAAVLVMLLLGAVLAGCGGHKDAAAGGPPPPSDAKMGAAYGQGVAGMHSQQRQVPQTGAPANRQ